MVGSGAAIAKLHLDHVVLSAAADTHTSSQVGGVGRGMVAPPYSASGGTGGWPEHPRSLSPASLHTPPQRSQGAHLHGCCLILQHP